MSDHLWCQAGLLAIAAIFICVGARHIVQWRRIERTRTSLFLAGILTFGAILWPALCWQWTQELGHYWSYMQRARQVWVRYDHHPAPTGRFHLTIVNDSNCETE